MRNSDEKVTTYNHTEVEAFWQGVWREQKLNVADIAGHKPFYNLMMFPYPSAEGLHVGNMYAFTGSDIYGRFKRMQGYNVFEPIGLDGFGIHSENYALKVGKHPMDQAQKSQQNFYRQLGRIGAMFDWSRTLETYNPNYYRWTQWLFVAMFKHGLAYRGKAEVNWCPSCKTVLADEQVIKGSGLKAPQCLTPTAGVDVCERCGNIVEKRLLEQWFFKITAYAEKLLGNLSGLDWSEKVKVAQQHWIGKKEGIIINYPIDETQETISVFTTRPDTNFGATFVVIAPEHPYVAELLKSKEQRVKSKDKEQKAGTDGNGVIENKQSVRIGQIRDYVEAAKKKTPEERIAEGKVKTGVYTGLNCINQLNGSSMPLYISDFVLMGVGTGAVVGVPGHDLRDFAFAQTFDLPIVRVVVGKDGDTTPIFRIEQVQEEEGNMVNSGFLNGLDIHEATVGMMDHLEKNGWGKRVTTYHLRDWLISRQRYWGPPIPMIYCKKCAGDNKGERKEMPGWWTVPEDQLPVILPRIEDYKPGDDGVAPLAKHKEFYETKCPGCGGKAVRETDVSDTFLDSSWYFLRYPSINANAAGVARPNSGVLQSFTSAQAPSVKNSNLSALPAARTQLEIKNLKLEIPWDREVTRRWLPVDMYTGGAEHSVLHLLYSRFVTMALKDWGYLEFKEPFTRFYAHGLVIKDGAKMSKSKGNVVNPDEYIASYGADALRLYLMFMGPFSQGGDFRDSAMEGTSRWLGRVWRMAMKTEQRVESKEQSEIQRALHRLVKKVTDDMEKRRYNTAIAGMMEFTNLVEGKSGSDLNGFQGLTLSELKTFILLLAPFAPHIAEELYQRVRAGISNFQFSISNFNSVHVQSWPSYDASALAEETVTIIVQVNGKVRDTIKMKDERSKIKDEVEELARKSEKVQKFLEGKIVKNVIFVPGKLINFVVG